ncbi:uncharacterized protein MYCFIDRAFT_177972 [Pseudocercospora fijiensis CIRAD86]|uniref:Uncharacterized protein n=1 Tax=Pseudocercospora fijiensis (strain CIRAD86) TaxID=383855 RepID=M3APK8_PSEFD|nr:uncharacterized protein MYCFIDRAFT_177972 [Pseudocercospora fijiensis CIRAD86]EME79372.1 hypothetical protein MYCFIDRAFT_177972 [Pseudocercospora fijiensis CIRAD86]
MQQDSRVVKELMDVGKDALGRLIADLRYVGRSLIVSRIGHRIQGSVRTVTHFTPADRGVSSHT